MKHIIIVVLLTILLVSCGITDFEMPSWDVELTSIPLMNDEFPASDLEGENIIIENDSLFAVVDDQLEETTPDLYKTILDSTPNVGVLSNTPVQIRFEIQSINTNTSFRIIDGEFESGEMDVNFTGDVNNFNLLHIDFNQLLDENGQILSLELSPSDFIDNSYIIDLAGVTITDQDIDGEFWLIDIDVIADSDQPTASNLGDVQLVIDDDIYFRSFTGYIDDVHTLDTQTDVDIDYPSDVENAVILDEISLYFDVYNKIGFEFELMGELTAYRDGLIIDTIHLDQLEGVDFVIQASNLEGEEVITHFEIINNERVNQMLRLMPDNIALLNPTYKVYNLDDELPGFVSNQHTIRSEYNIKIPFKATFNDDYIIYPDKLYEIEISEDNQDLIDERVNSGSINLTVENTFPIGGILDIFLSSQELEPDEENLTLAELQFTDYDIQVTSNLQDYEISLSEEDLELFLHDKVYMRTRVKFHNSNGVVTILPTDNLVVKGNLNISVRID